MNRLVLFSILVLVSATTLAGNNTLKLGLKMKKTPNLYYENGVAVDLSSDRFLNNKLHLGASFVSSRLGSALGSNALKQEEYLISAGFVFRNGKLINPILKINTGLFMLDTEFEIFSDLPDKSVLLSAELGLGYDIDGPFDLTTTVGYNLITGNGMSGPGTLYPVFLNLMVNYTLQGGYLK